MASACHSSASTSPTSPPRSPSHPPPTRGTTPAANLGESIFDSRWSPPRWWRSPPSFASQTRWRPATHESHTYVSNPLLRTFILCLLIITVTKHNRAHSSSAIPPPLPRRPRRLGRRRIRHRPEERHLRRTWVSPSSTVGGPLLAGGDRPHPSRRKRDGGQQPTSRIPMSVLRLREGPSPRPHLQRRWSSPCRPTTKGSWRRSASAPTLSCTAPSSSRPTGPSSSSALILIDSTVTCRWPCPPRGGGAGGAHPATTVAVVKCFFHLELEIHDVVVQPPKVKVTPTTLRPARNGITWWERKQNCWVVGWYLYFG
ncbi:uncharacterized protein [Triticum aestivum]|uniref:uncharacterized protein n=1 Tax=Triticum aestivum TaxID=4565 RepID=UPI001D02514E|nr:uncharacterized protein LOC123166774 [Triticum aestivum]